MLSFKLETIRRTDENDGENVGENVVTLDGHFAVDKTGNVTDKIIRLVEKTERWLQQKWQKKLGLQFDLLNEIWKN